MIQSIVLPIVIGLIMLIILGILIYFGYSWIRKIFGGIFPDKPLQCPENMQSNDAGLCFEKCPEDWEWDGASFCYKKCPSNWEGTSTIAHCQHDAIYSTVGTQDSIPNRCSERLEYHDGLCYENPDPELYEYSSPGLFHKKCKPGERWDGTGCWIDALSFGRGAGYGWKVGDPVGSLAGARERCRKDHGEGHCQTVGAFVYPRCQYLARTKGYDGTFVNDGCCVCARRPEVYYPGLESVIGHPPTECPGDKEKHLALCYPKCPEGYERTDGNVEFCTNKCPSGFTDIGIGGCERPKKELPTASSILEVGVCPEGYYRKGDGCFKK